MSIFFKSISFIFFMISGVSFAADAGDDHLLREEVTIIKRGLEGLLRLSRDEIDPGSRPIYDVGGQAAGRTPIGSICADEQKNMLFILFRGTDNQEELLETQRYATSNTPCYPYFRTVEGRMFGGHLGTFYSTATYIYEELCKHATNQGKKLQDDYGIVIYGYSLGGVWAERLAASLYEQSQHPRIRLYTFGGLCSFDSQAVATYPSRNIKALHFSVEEDRIGQYLNGRGFHHPGPVIVMSAEDCRDYRDRVSRQDFTNMDPELTRIIRQLNRPLSLGGFELPGNMSLGNILGNVLGINDLLPLIEIRPWEAHYLGTYIALWEEAFIKFMGLRHQATPAAAPLLPQPLQPMGLQHQGPAAAPLFLEPEPLITVGLYVILSGSLPHDGVLRIRTSEGHKFSIKGKQVNLGDRKDPIPLTNSLPWNPSAFYSVNYRVETGKIGSRSELCQDAGYMLDKFLHDQHHGSDGDTYHFPMAGLYGDLFLQYISSHDVKDGTICLKINLP